MVPRYVMLFVWVMLHAQFFRATGYRGIPAGNSPHHHEFEGMSSFKTVRIILGNSISLMQQGLIGDSHGIQLQHGIIGNPNKGPIGNNPDEPGLIGSNPDETILQQKLTLNTDETLLHELQASGAKKKKNPLLCRTLGRRCLQIIHQEDDSILAPSQGVAEERVDPPMADLPTLPTDPDSPSVTPRTNPSSPVLAPPGPESGSSSSTAPALSSLGGKASTSSGLAGKVGISAGVGATGVALLLLLSVLYYFKPDMFLCCKTCVRVQIFHHNHASKK